MIKPESFTGNKRDINPSVKRSWRRAAIRLGGSAAILALLFTFLPFQKIIDAFQMVPIGMWLTAVVLYLNIHLIGVVKWRLMINTAGGEITFTQAVRCYYYGLFGNTFLPSVVGGDIIRVGLAVRLTRSKSGVILGSVVDRAIDSVGLASVAGIGAFLLPTTLGLQSRYIFFGFAGVFAIGALAVLALILLLPVRRFSFKVRRKFVKVRRAIRALVANPGRIVFAFILVLILQTLLVVMNYWLGLYMDIHVSFVVWLFVWPLAKLSAFVPITQGGIGVREAAQAALFIPFGVMAVKAVSICLVFQTIIICGGLIGGILSYIMGRRFVTSIFQGKEPVHKNVL